VEKGIILIICGVTPMQEHKKSSHHGADILPHPSAVYGELEYRLKQQAIVAELGDDALMGIDLDRLFDKTVAMVAGVLNNEYCKVLELLPGGDYVFLRAGVGWRDGLVGNAKVDTGVNSQAGYTLISKEPVIVKDLRSETRFDGPSLLREHGVVSGMSVIIQGPKGPWGVLGTHTKRYHEFTQYDINFFQSVANILANAIERKRTESELQKAADTLEQRVNQRTKELANAKAELQEMTRLVTHELQGPLRLIVSYQGLLSSRYKGRLGHDADNFLTVLSGAAKKIERMIDDLWTYAGIENPSNYAVSVHVDDVLEKTLASLKDEIKESGAQIAFGKMPKVLANPSQVEYLFNQVLRNALCFRKKMNTPQIDVTSEQQGSTWVFVVQDNGIGFDMLDRQNIFKMFTRLNGDEFPGTGMGLSICKKIVELNGGDMWAESGKNSGTKIYFTLPGA